MKKVVLIIMVLGAFSVHANETSIVDLALGAGIKACKSNLKVAADHIIGGNAHETHALWNNEDADNRMYATHTIKKYADGVSHVTVVAAPTAAGKCDATYVETVAVAQSCMAVREETFSGWKYETTVADNTLVLENEGGGVNVYLTPQDGNICLVSKREVIYP